jgi:ATP-dependent DNA helicase RecG
VFAVFDGVELIDDLLDKQEIVGTLPELIRQTKAKIRTFLPRPATFSGLQREERPAVSDNVIREAVVNAVCHRDYSIANRKTAVYIFRDRLEIISPGRLPNTLTVEKILTGNSAPRNHFLLKYLDNMKFIDGLGRGVPMMRREMGERLHYQEEGEILRLLLDFETPLACPAV